MCCAEANEGNQSPRGLYTTSLRHITGMCPLGHKVASSQLSVTKPMLHPPQIALRFQWLRPSSVKGTVVIVQELCESRGGRPGLSVLTSLLVSVDVKIY